MEGKLSQSRLFARPLVMSLLGGRTREGREGRSSDTPDEGMILRTHGVEGLGEISGLPFSPLL